MRVVVLEPRPEPSWLTNMHLPEPVRPDPRPRLREWVRDNGEYLEEFRTAVYDHVRSRDHGESVELDIDRAQLDADLLRYVYDCSSE
jgi:hypothetical protein